MCQLSALTRGWHPPGPSELYFRVRMTDQVPRHNCLFRVLPAGLIILAVGLGGCANGADGDNTRASAPKGHQSTAAASPPPHEGSSQVPREAGKGSSANVGKPRKKQSATDPLAGLSEAELRRAARRVARRLERRPELEAQNRSVERLLARAEPIVRQLKRHPRKHGGEDPGELSRKAQELLERLRQD